MLYAKIEAETGWSEYRVGAVDAACASQRERLAASAIRCFLTQCSMEAERNRPAPAIHAHYAARIGLWPTKTLCARSSIATRHCRSSPGAKNRETVDRHAKTKKMITVP
jgi:hypothetical protein